MCWQWRSRPSLLQWLNPGYTLGSPGRGLKQSQCSVPSSNLRRLCSCLLCWMAGTWEALLMKAQNGKSGEMYRGAHSLIRSGTERLKQHSKMLTTPPSHFYVSELFYSECQWFFFSTQHPFPLCNITPLFFWKAMSHSLHSIWLGWSWSTVSKDDHQPRIHITWSL